MKLLIYLSSMKLGGAERVAATLANYWAMHGIDVTVLTLSADPDFYELDPRINRKTLDMQSDSSNVLIALFKNFSRIRALRSELKTAQPDIVLALMTSSIVYLGLASVGLGIKTIGAEHTYPANPSIGRFWNFIRKHTFRFLDAIVALTSEGEAWLREHTSSKKVVTIPNPAVWPLPSYAPLLALPPKNRRVLLTVGRLVVEKGFDLLIDAFSRIAQKHQDWELIIVGEGEERIALESKIQSYGLQNQVFLPGRAGNVGDWYQHADLFVMSSRVEGFPNVLVEAMSFGLAAVSFDCNTGPRDIIIPGNNGLLVEAGDIDALGNALDRVMADDGLRRQLGDQATLVKDTFSIKKVTSIWQALFATL
jgi:glycosyltransferase involved in cell wall biosynthesis